MVADIQSFFFPKSRISTVSAAAAAAAADDDGVTASPHPTMQTRPLAASTSIATSDLRRVQSAVASCADVLHRTGPKGLPQPVFRDTTTPDDVKPLLTFFTKKHSPTSCVESNKLSTLAASTTVVDSIETTNPKIVSQKTSKSSNFGPPAAAQQPTVAPQNRAGIDDGVSEYERQRLANIARNTAMLVSLGLDTRPCLDAPTREAAAVRRFAKARPKPTKQEHIPRRKSARLRVHISAQSEDAGTSEAQSERQESEDEPIEYDDSSVLQYDCHGTESASQVGVAVSEGECHGASCKGRLLGFAPRTDEGPQQLADGSLTKVYTMDWAGASGSGWLLAAGGHGGRVAVFGGGKQPSKGLSSNGGETLLSWKAHHGWVGHVQFCGRNGDHNGGGSRLLLTASNDKSLMIWDLNKVAGGTPRVASKTLGLHAGGIFSADVDAQSGLAVLTSGKDGATVLSNLRPDGSGWADVGRRFDRHHFGHVVKCCRFQSAGESQLFADTGNSKDICIMDPRLPRNEPSLRLQGVHPTAVNALAWSKRTEWLLASASFSPAVLLHDLRSPSRSIPSLLGHCGGNSARTGRLKAIYHPVFVDGDAALCCGGEGSGRLSLYNILFTDAKNGDGHNSQSKFGAAISRGELGFDATALAWRSQATNASTGPVLAVAGGGKTAPITLLSARRG